MTKFSVIIPLYNKEKDILKTLESLLNQQFEDFEAVIVDDGSTDESAKIVESVQDDRIRFFSKKNEGVALTRNYGVKQANSEYIAFLDADDYWYPHHLKTLSQMVDAHPQEKWLATAYEKKHRKNFTTSMISPLMKKHPFTGIVEDYFENSLIDALAWTSAVCMRRDFFFSLGGFDATITNGAGEDTDLWIRAALEAPLVFTTEITACHNLIGSNRISFTPTKNRIFLNPDNYEERAKKDPSLKKYLDVNRFSFAIQHKLAKDFPAFWKYVRGLNPENLTRKQRFLLKQPRWALLMSKQLKKNLESLGLRVTAYK